MIDILKLVPIATLATAGVAGKNGISAQYKKMLSATEIAVTQQELNDLAKMIYLDHIGDTYVAESQFPDYCRKNLLTKVGNTRDTSLDRWGTYYRICYSPGNFKVQSAGPDKVFDTEDDIQSGYNLTK